MTTMKFTFNSGRLYQPAGHEFAGQVIEVEVEERGVEYVVRFRDLSRRLDGAFWMPTYRDGDLSEAAVREEVMAHYDENLYTPIDYFEHLEKERAP